MCVDAEYGQVIEEPIGVVAFFFDVMAEVGGGEAGDLVVRHELGLLGGEGHQAKAAGDDVMELYEELRVERAQIVCVPEAVAGGVQRGLGEMDLAPEPVAVGSGQHQSASVFTSGVGAGKRSDDDVGAHVLFAGRGFAHLGAQPNQDVDLFFGEVGEGLTVVIGEVFSLEDACLFEARDVLIRISHTVMLPDETRCERVGTVGLRPVLGTRSGRNYYTGILQRRGISEAGGKRFPCGRNAHVKATDEAGIGSLIHVALKGMHRSGERRSTLWAMFDAPLEYSTRPGQQPGTMILSLVGPLTLNNLYVFQNEFRAMTAPVLIVDLQQAPYMDSAGLALLMSGYLSAMNDGRKLILAAPNHRITALLEMTRVDQVLTVASSVEDAEGGLSQG